MYSDKVGRNTSADTSLRQLPWGGSEKICARRWHMRYARGVVYKEGPYEQLAELQIDTVALKRGLLMGENAKADCEEEKIAHNERLMRRIDSRWELKRTEESDTMKKPLITYPEWIAIDGKVRGLPIEQGGAASRWKLWEDRPTEEKRKWLKEL